MPERVHLFYEGPGNSENFCDHDDADENIECDDDHLWAILEDGVLVGFVCSPHKDAYLKEVTDA